LHILDQPKTFLALVAADAEPVRVQLYAALDAEVLLALDRRLRPTPSRNRVHANS
jgi:hypothetical protein